MRCTVRWLIDKTRDAQQRVAGHRLAGFNGHRFEMVRRDAPKDVAQNKTESARLPAHQWPRSVHGEVRWQESPRSYKSVRS